MAQETGSILAQTQVASITCLTKTLLLISLGLTLVSLGLLGASYLILPFISGISPDDISHFRDTSVTK